MSTNKKIHLLCTDADRAALESVLKHLQEKGLRVSEEGNVQKDDIVLAALSENLYADRDRVETLLTLIGSGTENILPLQLDEAVIPDTLKTALYARNIISAAGRDDFQIAERILSAMPQKKSRLPLILATAGVILLAVIGFVFLRPAPSVESIPVEPEVTEPAYVLPAGLTEEDLEKVWQRFTSLSASKEMMTLKELEAIVATEALQVPPAYTDVQYVINTGSAVGAMSHMKLLLHGKPLEGISTGDGAIDAAFNSIEKATGRHFELDDFQIQSVTEGREAMGETIVRLRSEGKLYSGKGISTDIVGAGIMAYINALNKIIYEEEEA